jgi:TetR/AcrR family fatty acid metabolism transcriptional regulator
LKDGYLDMPLNTKEKIINVATDVIYEKGYHRANITEIAELADISPSVIYRYFANKEDLLFSIPLENSIQFYKILENDLQGIEGNENLLRKLMWSLLNFYDLNPKYAIILLMECRSNQAFYQSQAYRFIRRLSKMFISILGAGKESGDFNEDTNSMLVRDLIFGGIDQSVLSCMVLNEINKITDDSRGIFQLFQNMVRIQADKKNQKNDKGNLLLDAAIQVFSQKGYHEATISEIARRANVSDGILYQYFENKEDLLFSIAGRKISDDLIKLNEIFDIKNPLRKIRRFIKYHCNLCLKDQNYILIFLTLIQTNRNFYQLPAYEHLKQYGEIIINIIEEGQKADIFLPEVNPRIFRNMLLGGLNHIFLRWFIVGKSVAIDKMSEIEEVTDLLVASITK